MAKKNASKKTLERFNKPRTYKDMRTNATRGKGAAATPPPRRKANKKLGEPRRRGERKPKKAASAVPLGFTPDSAILLVGEGDLGFAASLVRLLGCGTRVVATTLDSESALAAKYGAAASNAEELQAAGAAVGFGVDATALGDGLRRMRKRLREAAAAAAAASGEADAAPAPQPPPTHFHRIVFNFPHLGSNIADQERSVAAHQALLLGFFRSALPLLAPGGEVLLTLKLGLPYSLWQAPRLAHAAAGGALALRTAAVFDAQAFPGYAHRRTRGDEFSEPTEEALQAGARTYIWRATAAGAGAPADGNT